MDVGAIETPVSVIVFVHDRVYKVKRPVKLDFVDFTDVTQRAKACEAEVELNRRLSPDVYEGVGAFVGPGGDSEPVVVMRRMPAQRNLAHLVAEDAPDLAEQLGLVAAELAEFHRRQRRRDETTETDCLGPAVVRLWRDVEASLLPYAHSVLDADRLGRVTRLAGEYLVGRVGLLAGRVGAGYAVDGHGDLLADDIFCLEDGPRILDCLEFDARLRHLDGLADAAFLALDLERLGRSDLAWAFLRSYGVRADDEEWPDSLAHHWMAYRALVRAKVACLRWAGGEAAAATEARQLLDLALIHAEAGTIRLVLIGGTPGTGKSTLARRLAAATGWPVLSSDVIRRELNGLADPDVFGRGHGSGHHQDRYGQEAIAEVYAELLERARGLLATGFSVILDASWVRRCWRDGAAGVAEHARLVPIACRAPLELTLARIEWRTAQGADPSEATPGVARTMTLDADPWPEAAVVDTSSSPDESLGQALAVIRRQIQRR